MKTSKQRDRHIVTTSTGHTHAWTGYRDGDDNPVTYCGHHIKHWEETSQPVTCPKCIEIEREVGA